MIKKWMTALLAVCLVLCLTACDGGNAGGGTTTTTTTTTKATTTTTTMGKPTLTDEELETAFIGLAEKAYLFGSFSSVYELSPHSVAPFMHLMLEGERVEYAKAADGTPLYQETLSIADINAELGAVFGVSFDFTGVRDGVGDPATYKYEHPNLSTLVYYDLDHNLNVETYTLVCDGFTTEDHVTYTVNYHADYSGSTADRAFVLTARYLGNDAFMVTANQEQ